MDINEKQPRIFKRFQKKTNDPVVKYGSSRSEELFQ